MQIVGQELILIGLEALLGIDLPPDAAYKGDPFVAMILDQVPDCGAHPFFVIRDEHRSAVDLYGLRNNGNRAVIFYKCLKVVRAYAMCNVTGQEQTVEISRLGQVI